MRLTWPFTRRHTRPATPALRPLERAVEEDRIEWHAWARWEPPRNYIVGESNYMGVLSQLAGPSCEDGCIPVVVSFVRAA